MQKTADYGDPRPNPPHSVRSPGSATSRQRSSPPVRWHSSARLRPNLCQPQRSTGCSHGGSPHRSTAGKPRRGSARTSYRPPAACSAGTERRARRRCWTQGRRQPAGHTAHARWHKCWYPYCRCQTSRHSPSGWPTIRAGRSGRPLCCCLPMRVPPGARHGRRCPSASCSESR